MFPLVVIKVGGSLLDWPDLPRSWRGWLDSRTAERRVVIVGGGPAADLVRDLDRTHGLGPERSHQLALRALDLTAHLGAALVPGLQVTDSLTGLAPVWDERLIPVLAPRKFLDEDERTALDPLPRTWDVTTDSIAARVADRLGAIELVLLKSIPIPAGIDREAAARLGLVDPAFPAAARRLERVTLWNLRDPSASAEPLRP